MPMVLASSWLSFSGAGASAVPKRPLAGWSEDAALSLIVRSIRDIPLTSIAQVQPPGGRNLAHVKLAPPSSRNVWPVGAVVGEQKRDLAARSSGTPRRFDRTDARISLRYSSVIFASAAPVRITPDATELPSERLNVGRALRVRRWRSVGDR